MILKNKIILITGATGGIGKATALKFAIEGSMLILVYHNKSASLEDLEKQFTKSDTTFLSIKADLTKLTDIKNLFNVIEKKYKNIDVLVNMAGIEPIPSDPLDTEQWKKVFDVNFLDRQNVLEKL